MGIFSSKKKTYVSAAVYNLAGPEENRNNFLLNTVLAAVMTSNSKRFMGDTITYNYLHGPGIKLRSFGRWATRSGFTDNVIRQTVGDLRLPVRVSAEDLIRVINPTDPNSISLVHREYGLADFNYWAMQYMMENHPEKMNDHWAADMDDAGTVIHINFYEGEPPEEDEDGEPIYLEEPVLVSQETFTPVNFDLSSSYVYAIYSDRLEGEEGEVREGDLIELEEDEDFPDTEDFSLVQDDTVTTEYELKTTVVTEVTHSDDTDPTEEEEITTELEPIEELNQIWEKDTYMGAVEDSDSNLTYTERETLKLFTTHVIKTREEVETTVETITKTIEPDPEDPEGVPEEVEVEVTTTVTTTIEYLEPVRTYSIDKQDVDIAGFSPTKIFIYRIGSGNPVLDAITETTQSMGKFFPTIPIRYGNRSLSPSYYPDIYREGTKAVRRSIGGKLSKIIKTVEESESIKDIDHAYITYGVSLNVKDNACKKYIYKFFQLIMAGMGDYDHALWEQDFLAAQEKQNKWREWSQAQKDPSNPLYGKKEPEFVSLPYSGSSSLNFRIIHSGIWYIIDIAWKSIQESGGAGKYKPDAKRGQVWIEPENTLASSQADLELSIIKGTIFKVPLSSTTGAIRITWQETKTSYRSLVIHGLTHNNVIHRGKGVFTTAAAALKSADESAFIIPLHADLFRSISLVDATQMANACTFVLFNSYKRVKTKWYQRGAFKILVVIAVVALSVMFPPAGVAAGGAGVLGANATVGALIGFSGVSAIIAGAIVNAVAALVITQVLTKAATALFGDKLGIIIGAIASIVTINMGQSLAAGNGWASNFGSLMRADNLMKLGMATGQTYVHGVNQDTAKIAQETEAMIAEYEKETKRIQELYAFNIGNGSGVDIKAITEMASKFEFYPENADSFITRTLMTGTDIAELTNSMISDFATMTTSLELT